MSRNRLYLVLLSACLAGFAWLLAADHLTLSPTGKYGPCLFRMVTGIPCPSCGSTRSVLALVHGDFAGSLHWNPLGFLILAIMILLPGWIFADGLMKKASLFKTYRKAEQILRRSSVAIPAIMVLLANWVWNIIKMT